jgi:hypothetical protein
LGFGTRNPLCPADISPKGENPVSRIFMRLGFGSWDLGLGTMNPLCPADISPKGENPVSRIFMDGIWVLELGTWKLELGI